MYKKILLLGSIFLIPTSAFGQSQNEAGVVFYLSSKAPVTWFDIALLMLCPFFGAIGGLVARHLRLTEMLGQVRPMITYKNTEKNEVDSTQKAYISYPHVGPNTMLVGGVLGLVVALYFVGAITDEITSLARVFALCILLGYQAPNLWQAQAKVISSLVDDRLRAILGDKEFIARAEKKPSDRPPKSEA
ncbi:hypothetical protein [Rheinheimera oceanensis]|uniref:hypothetical protein n=1 Tax=Rheinheimera oceanensis TaxID=2817449 RepID=UPI001BFE269C|nr:hypothetical protein [Rheinheimera oceanensis]